ncbi:MAG TPA: hypothetical protein EYG68_11350 [Leucothrix mucor]|nr:hypothetical protein [Leucothrix mucor]
MKKIGLIGGMSWESTASYYRLINEAVKEKMGGLHSAELCLYSVDFAEIEAYQHAGDWDKTAAILIYAAQSLEKAGAEGIILGCTEIALLVRPEDTSTILFDTTKIHALAAVDWALS